MTHVARDAERLTLTIPAEFEAPIEQVWQLWENPRHLEQWWGPPMYPATFVNHALGMDEGMDAAMGQIPDILRTAATST